MLLCPLLTFYLLEGYIHNPWQDMKLPSHLLNIFFFELVMLLFLMIFGKLKTALMVETGLFMIVGLINFYVLSFRSAPIMPWDIYSIKTAVSVSDNFSYALGKETVFILIGFLLLLFFESRATLTLKGTWKLRLGGLAAAVAVLYGFVSMLHEDSSVVRFKLYDKLFTPTVMSKRDGTAVAFLMELEYLTVEKPARYSANAAKELLASYEQETAAPEKKPNIIVIMNEAFSDLSLLGDFETNEDYMPFVHSLMQEGTKNTISGNLNVSVLGGNTANTEFEFLTGNTMAFLPQGSIPYQQYVRGEFPTLVSLLRDYGYDTVAMHPYNSTGWERDTVYPTFGFSKSLFIRDWKNPEKIRKYVSDKSCYDKIIETYEQKEENVPLFVFNVTMQNHSSYSEEFENFKPDITVSGTNSKILPNYLSLIKLSDKAIEELIRYFENEEEETIIVFFGDHQPTDSVVAPIRKLNGQAADSLTLEDEALRYKVPFFLWANYEIEEASGVETSPNFLGGRVLETAGLPLSGYYRFLADLEETYPVISSIRAEDENGVSHEIKEVKKDLNDYAILQYFYLLDRK